ncbi:uncharacterized protein LOC125055863 [Pieris napi]|uniref:uncharacterized protein LOC125055863 n=1 Tax=Pieris napi TaxID=78633 RepID=UPI001FBAFBAE|nr:uncharacterized protein LOC125055863 [Pieris napi]
MELGWRLLLLLVHLTPSQALQLQKINRNPGLLPIKEGQAVVAYDRWTVIKILDFKAINNELKLNINNFLTLKTEVQNCFDTSLFNLHFQEVQLQTSFIMNITVEKYKQLVPTSKSKRGLLNPIGTFIKAITGNLDNEDAIRYEDLINKLKTRQDAISNKITIVSEMMSTVTKIINVTRNNFIQIKERFEDIDLRLNNSKMLQMSNEIIHFYNIFTHNFQTIYSRLNEIETALAFARIKILHQSIIDTKELLSILKEIESMYNLVFPVNIENIVKIELNIEMEAYIKQNQIKFIMHIPLIKNELYNYYKLIPLPVHSNSNNISNIILPKYPYVLVKGLKVEPLSQPCQEIDENRFLCPEFETAPVLKDECITTLMNFSPNTSSCRPVPVLIEDVKIYLVQQNHWIIFSRIETIISKMCDNDVSHEPLMGTYLLTLDDDCSIRIKDFNLKRHEHQGNDIAFSRFPIVNLPLISSEIKSQNKRLNLDGIDLADVQLLNLLVKNSVPTSVSESELNQWFFGIINIVISFLLMTCVILLAFKNRIKKIMFQPKQNIRDHPNPEDNLDSKERGVIQSQDIFPNL